MKSKRSIIRAVLFVIRLQKSVATQHAFPTTFRRESPRRSEATASPKIHRRDSPSCPPFSGIRKSPAKLKRCESTRHGHKQTVKQKAATRHRNSAPTTIFFRPSTPCFEILEQEKLTFATYSSMVQPYALKLEQPGSGGKSQFAVHPTVVHHLASRILLQKQPSLDDRLSPFNDGSNRPESSVSKLIRRQGSVECNEKKKPATSGPSDRNLRRKVKNTMISVYGALTAIEQDDLESLRMILQQNSVPINDSVTESSLYSSFSCPVSLLDVALMLNRQNAASLLLYHGATENPELNDLAKRESAVNNVVIENENRLQNLKEKSQPSKEEEKKIYLLEHHLNYLRKMNAVIKKPKVPNPPSEVKVEVTSSSRATITFDSSEKTDPCVVIKYKVEWSLTPNFEKIINSQIINDIRIRSVTIANLKRGKCYTFRVSAGSMWGFGEPTVAHPKNLRISSWEDSNVGNLGRNENMRLMIELHEQIEKHRQSGVWQVVFPNNNEIAVKKKKTGLKNLFSASSRFIKNVGRGIYLASIIYTEDKVLCTVDDCLPIIQIDENIISITNDDIGWLMKLSMGWDQVANLQDSMGGAWSSNWPLRAKILEAVASMHNALGVKDIGRIHYMPLMYSNTTSFLTSIHFVTESQATQSQGLAMRWMRLTKLIRKKQSNSALDFLNKEVLSVLNFFEASQIPLDRGLYLCYLKLQSSLNTIRVTVPDNLPSMLPYVSVRPNPHVTQEEWEWLRLIENDETGSAKPTPIQFAFHNQLLKAGDSLVHDLDLDSDLIRTHRLYRLQVLELHPDVSVIMVFPRAEDVCQVHASYDTVDDSFTVCKGCSSIPIPVFEILSFSTYQPDFIATYCRLNVFLEHFITIIGYEKRQCLRESDEKVYAEQLEKMVDFQQRLDDIWKSARWISNYASIARDKSNTCSVLLSNILTPPPPALPDDNVSDIGYHSDQGSSSKLQESSQHSNAKIIGSFKNGENKNLNRSKSMAERKELKVEAIDKMFQNTNPTHVSQSNPIRQMPRRQQSDVGMTSKVNDNVSPKFSAVIRVFAAFDCALPKNTAIKLIVTPMTTSQEVIALVVEQIDKLSTVKNQQKQIKSEPKEFCLVSVIGARERRLRNEFNPMKLQPPWTRGRLYVRRCDAPISAILFGNESFV